MKYSKVLFAAIFVAVIMMCTVVASSAQADAAARKGHIAVMPFHFISNDNAYSPEQMGKQIQSACANSLRSNTHNVQVQDPMRTNALLVRNDITEETMAAFLPDEIAVILGVEYLVYGEYNLTNKGQTTHGSEVTTYKDKDTKEYDRNESKREKKGSEVTSTSSSTTTEYDARLDLNVYNDRGENIYSESRQPFSADPDAYHATLDYLIKRSPWGTKNKH